MKMKFILLTLVLMASTTLADSFYSSMGLGLPHYFVSPKAQGMGGAGLALIDRFALNALNPGALNIGNVTSVSVDMRYELIENRLGDERVNTMQGNAAGFRFVVPLKAYLKLITQLRPLTGSRYIFIEEQQVDQLIAFNRSVRGSGGMSAAGLGLQFVATPWLAFGAIANFNFGSFNEEWKTEFSEPGFETASDKINSHLWGGEYQFGLLIKPLKPLALGLVYFTGSELKVDSQIEFGTQVKTREKRAKVIYPNAVGVGLSLDISKLTLAADLFTQFWSHYEIDGRPVKGANDYVRIGAGLEYLDSMDPLVSYTRRVSYRLGGYIAQLPFSEVSGQKVEEKFLSLGLGLPFYGNRGRIDLAIEIGRRSSQAAGLYEDTVFRLTGSVTGTELWFQRRNR